MAMFASACGAVLPAAACQYTDIAIYLIPSFALAFLIRFLSASHPFFFIFTLAGTICHELAHFLAGLVTGARPTSFTVIPKRKGKHWQLGAVTLSRLTWYNAAPSALAPMLLLLIPVGAAWLRTRGNWTFGTLDLALTLVLAPQFLSFWPSSADWKIAVQSWPCLIVIGLAVLAWFQFVRMA
jgi:hypothetical protein